MKTPFDRDRELVYVFEAGFAAPDWPGFASYLEAHLAWIWFASKTPSLLNFPSARAWELPTNVSGSGDDPVYTTGIVRPSSTIVNSTRLPSRLMLPGATLPPTRKRR